MNVNKHVLKKDSNGTGNKLELNPATIDVLTGILMAIAEGGDDENEVRGSGSETA